MSGQLDDAEWLKHQLAAAARADAEGQDDARVIGDTRADLAADGYEDARRRRR